MQNQVVKLLFSSQYFSLCSSSSYYVISVILCPCYTDYSMQYAYVAFIMLVQTGDTYTKMHIQSGVLKDGTIKTKHNR